MPKHFYVGVVIYVMVLITGVSTIAYLLTSPRKKKRTSKSRHLRRRGDDDSFIKTLVRQYHGSDIEHPREWTQKLADRHITDKL